MKMQRSPMAVRRIGKSLLSSSTVRLKQIDRASVTRESSWSGLELFYRHSIARRASYEANLAMGFSN